MAFARAEPAFSKKFLFFRYKPISPGNNTSKQPSCVCMSEPSGDIVHQDRGLWPCAIFPAGPGLGCSPFGVGRFKTVLQPKGQFFCLYSEIQQYSSFIVLYGFSAVLLIPLPQRRGIDPLLCQGADPGYHLFLILLIGHAKPFVGRGKNAYPGRTGTQHIPHGKRQKEFRF